MIASIFFQSRQCPNDLFCFCLFSEGTTGTEGGGTGADGEAGSGVEEHSVSDGEENAQSRQAGGETQSRDTTVTPQSPAVPLSSVTESNISLVSATSLRNPAGRI